MSIYFILLKEINMKYSIIVLIVLSFVLTGCFEKKEGDDANTPNVPVIEDPKDTPETPVVEDSDIQEENTQSGSTQEEEASWSIVASGATQEETEIIEEYEEDLEALFDDLLGNGK